MRCAVDDSLQEISVDVGAVNSDVTVGADRVRAKTWSADRREVDLARGGGLLVEPQSPTLVSAYYTYPYGGNPQAGNFSVNSSIFLCPS